MSKFVSIKTEYPVPSCEIKQLIREDGKWIYEYEVEIKNSSYSIGEGPLYVWGHIQQLTLVSKIKKGHINITVNSMDEMINLIEKQAAADNERRRIWIKEHPDYYDNVVTITVKNETQVPEASNIVAVLKEDEETTTFIVIP